jgi:catechol 2,3-dioxygenase-like lactoylglutathione lyase family enzyme
MSIKNALAGVASRDLDAAVAWYTKLIGRAPDDHPMPEVYEFSFPGGGWVQIFVDADRAGKSSLTLTVDHLDETIARLRSDGIACGEPTRSDYVDTSALRDPDGNQVILAEAKSTANRAAS